MYIHVHVLGTVYLHVCTIDCLISLLFPCLYLVVVQFTKHLALFGMAEFVFHLTRLEPDLLHIARNTGCLTQAFLTFDINDKGQLPYISRGIVLPPSAEVLSTHFSRSKAQPTVPIGNPRNSNIFARVFTCESFQLYGIQ